MSEPLRFVLFGAGYWARPQLAAWGELPGARCAGIDMISGFPLFQQQPFLREVEQFILADLGSHTLDLARFLFGEAHDVACVAGRAHAGIRGEDHATVMMRMGAARIAVVVRMAYAENFVERECFPQTLCFIEGSRGSIEIAPGYVIKVTTREGTREERYPPHNYTWLDPRYAVVQSSIVACQASLLGALRGEQTAETTGEDNLRTVRLVHPAYESARLGQTVPVT